MNRLAALSAAGVSIWLDDLSRARLTSGSLASDVATRHIVGVTTNPSIFAKSVSESDDYASQLAELRAAGARVDDAVRTLTTDDVRAACDVLRPAFDATDGVDGRVSIEVDPRFARDTAQTIAEARNLNAIVDRPNVLIKIPATREGLPAIRAVLGEGISVNITLIFSIERYQEVVEAFLSGLEDAHRAGLPLAPIGSVASFFVSRVDTEVDKRLDVIAEAAMEPVVDGKPRSPLRGLAAIANARLAFEHHEHVLASPRWAALAAAGAKPQRPLWASTGVKDPSYPDTMYVDQLVTEGVVNTMPQATIDAYADHGQLADDETAPDAVRGTYDAARASFADLAAAGIDMDDVTAQLEREGVDKFVAAWDDLLALVAKAVDKA